MEKRNKSFKAKTWNSCTNILNQQEKLISVLLVIIPTSTGIADRISNNKKQRTDKFAFEFTGYIKIDKDAIYTFFTDSDDGSMLYIDDEEIVNNDGDHGSVEKNGKAALKKGYHKIKVLYFDSGGGNSLKVSLQPEGGKKEVISAALLFH